MTLPIQTATNSPASSRSQKAGFYIGVSCPGCGGQLELDDDFIVLVCDHCESVLRISLPDTPPAFMAPAQVTRSEVRFKIDRFLKKANLPLSNSTLEFRQLYYPYWKLEGILLKVRNKVYEKVVGVDSEYSTAQTIKTPKQEINLMPYSSSSAAAEPLAGIPMSVGLRANYLKVVPFSRENMPDDQLTIPVTTDWLSALKKVKSSVDNLGNLAVADFGQNVTELFKPTGSLVYMPFWVAESYAEKRYIRFVIDGITGSVLDTADRPPPLENIRPEMSSSIGFGELAVEFHRCQLCGSELGRQRTFVSVCSNCQAVNFYENDLIGFQGIYVATQQETTRVAKQGEEYFPFWSYEIPAEQVETIKRLFGGIFKSDWLTIPAFQNRRFESMYRLAKRVSSALPEIELEELNNVIASFQPVTIAEKEAQLLAEVMIRRRRLTHNYGKVKPLDIDFTNVKKRLIYLPFKQESYFCVDSVLGAITFEKSSVL